MVEQLVLGAAACDFGLSAAEAAIQVELLDVLDVALLGPALLGAVVVDESVGEDLVQPRLQVRALLEAPEASVGLQVGLLHKVLSIGRISGHPERGGIQRAHVLHRLVSEVRLIRHSGLRVSGRAQWARLGPAVKR